jgi:hypothetical protein
LLYTAIFASNPLISRLLEIISQISQAAVFFSHKKSASSTFSQPDQPKQTGRIFVDEGYMEWSITPVSFATSGP